MGFGGCYLRHVEKMVKAEGIPVDSWLRRGVPYAEIVRQARVSRADLVVLGSTTRTGSVRLGLGRVIQKVIEHADSPVLVVRHPG